jgi:hypothetical protein
MKYRIILAYDVPFYRTVDIEADTYKDATAQANAFLEGDEYSQYEPDYTASDGFRVVSVDPVEEETDPFYSKAAGAWIDLKKES